MDPSALEFPSVCVSLFSQSKDKGDWEEEATWTLDNKQMNATMNDVQDIPARKNSKADTKWGTNR